MGKGRRKRTRKVKGKGKVKVKLPGNGMIKKRKLENFVFESTDPRHMLNESKYIQGFDIKIKDRGYSGDFRMSGCIIPYYLVGRYKEIAIQYGKIAVEDYNNKVQKRKGVMLQFVKPLKINGRGFDYYITFEAKDVGAPDHQSRIYQTLVYSGFHISMTKVVIFRLKPETTPPTEKCCAKNLEESQEEYIGMSGSNDESDKICNP